MPALRLRDINPGAGGSALALPTSSSRDRHFVNQQRVNLIQVLFPNRFASADGPDFLFASVKPEAQLTLDVHGRHLPADCGSDRHRFGIAAPGLRALADHGPDRISEYSPL